MRHFAVLIPLLLAPTYLVLWSFGPAAAGTAAVCSTAGVWLDPQSGERRDAVELMATLATPGIVLLGENHTSAAHHRWQLHTLAGLQAHYAELVVGFEMFPRALQPQLDAWIAGAQSDEAFLSAVRWEEVWGYDADLYLPLLHFARQMQRPIVALNVERSLVSRVGDVGWQAVPEAQREGLSDPAPASAAYRHSLAEVYSSQGVHAAREKAAGNEGESQPEDIEAVLTSPLFERFVEAQLTWDRAMAEALYRARRDNPKALVVGILGRGHIEYGYGVPHQLADLGAERVTVLLPLDGVEACAALEPGVADAVFLLPPQAEEAPPTAKPRLGVLIETAEGGVRVRHVAADSIAEAIGLAIGDVITAAAGFATLTSADLVEVVQRQAPGTWLPLEVRRGEETLRLVAEFPSVFK